MPHEYDTEAAAFVEKNGIRQYFIPIPALKSPEQVIETESVVRALRILLEPECRPILVHCNKGKVSLIFQFLFLFRAAHKSSKFLQYLWHDELEKHVHERYQNSCVLSTGRSESLAHVTYSSKS